MGSGKGACTRRVLVLGPVAIELDGEIEPVRGQQGVVLSSLAAAYPDPVTLSPLLEVVWGGNAPRTAKKALSVVAHRLNERLGIDAVSVKGGEYRLDVDVSSLDLADFRHRLTVADDDVAAGRPARAADRLADALALWRGDPFQPFEGAGMLTAASVHLRELREEAEERMLEALLAAARADDAAIWGTRFVETAPYRERRWELLMLALYRDGRQAEALRTAQRATSVLREDLGLDPGPDLRQLEADILAQSSGLAGPRPATGDLGRFVETLRTTAGAVPAADTSFLGRAEDLAALQDLLERRRLVSVVGPAGSGKTRLVAEFARGAADRQVIWLDLVPLRADNLISQLAGRLGVRGEGDEALEAIADALRRRPALLVLDNCAHLVDHVAQLAEALPSACPEIKVVVTSRIPLGTPTEATLDLGPLERPAARQLLLDRAWAGAPPEGLDDDGLDRLVARLDAMPLHLELVARSLRTRPAGEVADGLRESLALAAGAAPADRRHGDLEAALSWSVDLLDAELRGLHEWLGALTGSFTAADVAALRDDPVDRVREQLSALAEHSLVSVDRSTSPPTFRQYQSVRTHARQRLDERGELASISAAVTDRTIEVVEEICAALRTPAEATAIARLRRMDDQLLATHEALLAAGDAARAVRFAHCLWWYTFVRQDFRRFGWIRDALELEGAEASEEYADALATAALASWTLDDFGAARRLAAQAEEVAEARGIGVPIDALRARFNVATHGGDFETAAARLVDLIAAAEERGTLLDRADNHAVLALGNAQLGLIDESVAAAADALRMAEECGVPSVVGWANHAKGVAQLLVDPVAAARSFHAAGREAAACGNVWVMGMASTALVGCFRRQGRTEQARRLLVDVIQQWAGARSVPQLARCYGEAVLLLADAGSETAAAQVLAHADELDHAHPLMGPDLSRFTELAATLRSRNVTVEARSLVEAAAFVRESLRDASV